MVGRPTISRNRVNAPLRIVALWMTVAVLVLGLWRPARCASPRDHMVVGLKAFQDGFYDLAAKELRAFLEMAPEDPRREDVLALLAQAEIQRQNWPEARAALTLLARGTSEEAREARYTLAWVLHQEARDREALDQLDAYLDSGAEESRVDALYLAAALADDLGEARSAGNRYATFLAEAGGDPRRAAAWVGLIRARDEAGMRDRALKASENAVEDPSVRKDAEALSEAALAGVELARKAGLGSEEVGFWEVLVKGLPAGKLRSRALYELGDAKLRAGDTSGARSALEEYLAESAEGAYAARAHLLLADLARRRSDKEAEYAHIDAALARPDDPAITGQRLELRRAAFRLALILGRPERAEQEARALLEWEAELPPGERALVQMTLASAAATAGREAEAVAHWDAVPEGTEESSRARSLAAQTLIELGRPAEALTRLLPLLGEKQPDPEVLLIGLAAAESAGEYGLAADFADRLAADPPRGRAGAEFLHQEALLRDRAGDRDGYLATLTRLVTTYPEDPRAPWFASELQRAAFQRRAWDEVLRWAPLAERSADGGASAYRKAEALAQLGRAEEARAAFLTLAESEGPYRGPALARLGVFLDEEGDREGAVRRYREATEAGLDLETLGWVRRRLEALEGTASGE